jgi:hypothetical protein
MGEFFSAPFRFLSLILNSLFQEHRNSLFAIGLFAKKINEAEEFLD